MNRLLSSLSTRCWKLYWRLLLLVLLVHGIPATAHQLTPDAVDDDFTFRPSPTLRYLIPGTTTATTKTASNAFSPTEDAGNTDNCNIKTTTTVTSGCYGTNTNQLQIEGSEGAGGYQYSIDGGATYHSSGTFQNLPAATYQVRVKDQNGCVASTTVQVQDKAEVVADAGPDIVMLSCTAVKVGTPALPEHFYKWEVIWNDGGQNGNSQSGGFFHPNHQVAMPNFSYSNFSSDTATVTLRLTVTFKGCSKTDEVQLKVQPFLLPGYITSMCSGDPVKLGTTWSPNVNEFMWRARPYPLVPGPVDPKYNEAFSSRNVASPTYNLINTSDKPDTIQISAEIFARSKEGGGCGTVFNYVFIVYPNPPQRIEGSISVCPGITNTVYTVADPAAKEYQWKVKGGSISSGQGTRSITVNWGPTTTGASVQAYAPSPYDCPIDTMRLAVRVNPLLITPTPRGSTLVCTAEGEDVPYETQFNPGSTYNWTVIGGTLVAPTTSHQARVRWHTDRPGKLVVTESSTTNLEVCYGASDTLFVQFTPSPNPALAIAGPDALCESTDEVTYTLAGLPGSTYQWRLDGNAVAGTGGYAVLKFPTAGTYTLSVRETSSKSCVGQWISKAICVNPRPVMGVLQGPMVVCPEGLLNHTYSVQGLPGSTFAWTVAGGTIRSGNGTNSILVDFNEDELVKSISVQETSAFSCTGPLLTRSLDYDNAELVINTATTLENDDRKVAISLVMRNRENNASNITLYRREAVPGAAWQQLALLTKQTTSYTDAAVDTYHKVYEYRVESMNSCNTTLSPAVHNTILLQATADEAQEAVHLKWNRYKGGVVSGYEIYRKLDNETGFSLFQTISPTDSAATLIAAKDGFSQTFRVKAVRSDMNGIFSWSNEASVSFKNKLMFFNIFTPNNDGKNDVFFIDNIHLYPQNELSVYNRTGQEVYRQKNYSNTWQGDNLPKGVYYYLLKLNDGASYRGWVEIAP